MFSFSVCYSCRHCLIRNRRKTCNWSVSTVVRHKMRYGGMPVNEVSWESCEARQYYNICVYNWRKPKILHISRFWLWFGLNIRSMLYFASPHNLGATKADVHKWQRKRVNLGIVIYCTIPRMTISAWITVRILVMK